MTTPPAPPTDYLSQMFRIGPDDIAANRSGWLGPRQRDHLRRGIYQALIGMGAIALGLGAIIYFVADRPMRPIQTIVSAIVLGGFLAAGVVPAWKLRTALRSSFVERVTGPVWVARIGRSGWRLTVAGRSFQMLARIWRGGNNVPYHVYVAPAANMVVGMEEAR